MAKPSYLNGLPPRDVELWKAQADYNADKVLVVIDTPDATEAKNDTWSKTINFKLVGENSGLVIPYSGLVGAAVTLTTGSGPTPVVSTATPTVVMGSGSVVVSHGDTGYDTGDVATMVITYTNMRAGTDTDSWKITFS
jgi:hypothetical protein